jgi:hypothetical protein
MATSPFPNLGPSSPANEPPSVAEHTPATGPPPPEHGPGDAAEADRWWPKERQEDWRQLPVATVEWLVIWNVNLGGGHAAFSVNNGYWGNHPFQPDAVAPEQAWVWWADNIDPPRDWQRVRHVGGIINLIAVTAWGMPTDGGIVLVPTGNTVDELTRLARTVDQAVAHHGGAWCPALVGDRDGSRFAISVQQTPDPTPALAAAETLGIDDIVIVDPFGDRGYRTTQDPEILVRGRRDGSGRTARAGQTAHASVPVPDDLGALRVRPIGEQPSPGRRS